MSLTKTYFRFSKLRNSVVLFLFRSTKLTLCLIEGNKKQRTVTNKFHGNLTADVACFQCVEPINNFTQNVD